MKASNPLHSVEERLRDFPPAYRYLIGVSGGRDSIALLHLLVEHGYKNVVLCHLDHELRGRASRTDARFVAKIARDLNLNCEIGSADVRALAKAWKLSIETAARVARFAFFVSVARKKRCRTIFLAHHADDLVETALLNLFRGASPGGIAAMRPVSTHGVGKMQLTIIRPLLNVWRSEIDCYVREHDLKFREDTTNAELNSARNRTRHRVLPLIERNLGRNVRKAIWRTAQIWIEEEALLDSLVAPEVVSGTDLAVATLRKMPVALQRRTIFAWLRAKRISDVRFEDVENVRSLLQPQTEIAKVNLSRDLHACRRTGKIFIE